VVDVAAFVARIRCKRAQGVACELHENSCNLRKFLAPQNLKVRFFRKQVLPQLRQMDGFEEFIALSDRQSGKLVGVVVL
jgi:hypothetical protein